MELEQAYAILSAVEGEQDRQPHMSAYNACKAAGVNFADYKAARIAANYMHTGY